MWLWLGVFGFILLVIGFVYRFLDQRAESKFHPHAPKQLLVKFKEGTTEMRCTPFTKKGDVKSRKHMKIWVGTVWNPAKKCTGS